jgi:ABC-type multidrug transport system ATPase subunit
MSIKLEISDNGFIRSNSVSNEGNSNQLQQVNKNELQEVFWRKLCYYVKLSLYRKKQILVDLNGSFYFGQITAILGPSGAGKTTLLDCLINKRVKGLNGCIGINGLSDLKAAIVPQDNYFLQEFTVREVLWFASRVKNLGMNHKDIVENVAKQLGLIDCMENNVKKCSGGQLKRLAIGQELVSQMNILILDEPTSGLDSSTGNQVMLVLHNLVKNSSPEKPIAVLTTIHQPGSRLFNMFDKIYALSHNGFCIYEGPPGDVMRISSTIGLNCPMNCNPAEHLLEICYGDYGEQKIQEFVKMQNSKYGTSTTSYTEKILNFNHKSARLINIHHYYYLWCRALKSLASNYLVLSLQICAYIIIPVLMSIMYKHKIGSYAGCPSDLIKSEKEEHIKAINENYGFLFFAFLMFMFGPMMITVLSFPLEMKVVRNEWQNGWYKMSAYFIGRSLADLPFQIVFPFLFCAIAYYMTGQINEIWRYIAYSSLMMAVSFCAQSQGLIFGAIFMDNLSAAVFVAVSSTTPIVLFGGYFIRIANMPDWISWMSYFSYFRYTFQAILIVIYGFDRCDCVEIISTSTDFSYNCFNTTNIVDFGGECETYAMKDFDLDDSILVQSIIGISLYLVITRIFTFLIVIWKISRKS